MNEIDHRSLLVSLFEEAVKGADPQVSIAPFLPPKPIGRTIVIGAGKGSAQMAKALESHWQGPLEGVVVTRTGFGVPCERIEIIEASHPVPDAAGLVASDRLLNAVSNLTADDLVIALISGGGSALLPAPPVSLTLEDEIALNEALLASGAPISAMNLIRKHVSRVKGGRLAAAAYPAKVVSLLVSDIPGDHAHFIASGPTVADGGSREQALDAIELYGIELSPQIKRHLATAQADAPQPDDLQLTNATHHVIASASISLQRAAERAQQLGIDVRILSDSMEGEARELGRFHGAIAREIAQQDRPFQKPVLLLSGGEATVTIMGKGRGGPNTEFLLGFAREIEGVEGIEALAADTDGVDGSENNAGAFANGTSMQRIRANGADPMRLQANNDCWQAFHVIDDLFIPGPTGTNVNDFRAILIT